jgi:hypothetical protein
MTSDMEPMTLTAEQCARLKFPVGCPVWYNFPRPNDDVPSSFFQKRGLVQGAIFRDGKVFYQVKYVTKSSNFISEEVEDGKLGFVRHVQLLFYPTTPLPIRWKGRLCYVLLRRSVKTNFSTL